MTTETKRQVYSRLLAASVRSLKTFFGRKVANREHQLGHRPQQHLAGRLYVRLVPASRRCNERYLQMYHLSAKAVRPGCTLRELIDHRRAAGLFQGDPGEYCRKILERNARGESWRSSTSYRRRCIEVINQLLPDGGWVVTHEDITERRRVSEEARQRTPACATRSTSSRTGWYSLTRGPLYPLESAVL